MKKEVPVRNYHLTDAVLKQKADEFVKLMVRDEPEFSERGYDAAAQTAYAAAIEVINNMSSDETLEAEKMILTENKNAARSILEKSMRTIFNMAANKYGLQSARYRSFGPGEISGQGDAQLVKTCKIMVKAATKNLADLSSEGLSQAKITALTSEGIFFDEKIDDLAEGISDRDIATEERIEAFNALYALLIKYAGIGQDIFYEVNEAKYNDYVIYDTPSGMPEEPTV